jgi:hypothetical protein
MLEKGRALVWIQHIGAQSFIDLSDWTEGLMGFQEKRCHKLYPKSKAVKKVIVRKICSAIDLLHKAFLQKFSPMNVNIIHTIDFWILITIIIC